MGERYDVQKKRRSSLASIGSKGGGRIVVTGTIRGDWHMARAVQQTQQPVCDLLRFFG